MKRKCIISFEGIDGCGKTTQAGLLYKYLQKKGLDAVFLNEPGGTAVGNRIRNLLLDRKEKPCVWSELFLYFASRAQLLTEVIERQAKDGRIVLLDRYIDSTSAYQGYGRGISVELIAEIHEAFIDGMFPDLTFLIDASAESLMTVLEKKDKDRIEQESVEFQKRVREGYLMIAEKEKNRIKTIKRKSVQETHKDIVKITEDFLNGIE
ncbi:MAG TPA: dTMP kinase [bacterium]|nr:dTMP kinase [bacterium]